MRLSIADLRVFPYKTETRQFDVSPVFPSSVLLSGAVR